VNTCALEGREAQVGYATSNRSIFPVITGERDVGLSSLVTVVPL